MNVSFAQIRLAYLVLAGVEMPGNVPFMFAGTSILEVLGQRGALQVFQRAQHVIELCPVGRPGSDYPSMAATYVARFGGEIANGGVRQKLRSIVEGAASEARS